MLCILKAEDMSRDHIVAITKGWIFDGDLTYALSLNDINLTWCCSQGNSNCILLGFMRKFKFVKNETINRNLL